jgi:DNA ligase-1
MIAITTIKPDSYDEATDTCTFPVLYKLDSLGKLRTWRMQRQGTTYRTLAGLADGKQAISGWTSCAGKQGRSDKGQAEFEIVAAYKHQLDREYHETADTVGTPKMIEPMLAKAYDKWPGPGYAQPKLDGIRCIADVNGLWTRQGQPIIAVPHIHAALKPLFDADPDLVLDGELYNHDLREDFGAISSIVRKKNPTVEQFELAEKVMQYHVYDVISMADQPFHLRSNAYHDMIQSLDCGWIIPVMSRLAINQEEADAAYGHAVEEGYEGGMYRLDKPYEVGRRSKALLKRKDFVTEEFRVVAVEEGKGNWAGAAKRMVLENDEAPGTFGAGIRGTYAAGVKLLADWQAHPEWWPTATATVRFFMRSPDGVPRFPVVVDFQPSGRKD